nr:hypothetical protein [bacterium]
FSLSAADCWLLFTPESVSPDKRITEFCPPVRTGILTGGLFVGRGPAPDRCLAPPVCRAFLILFQSKWKKLFSEKCEYPLTKLLACGLRA